MKKLPAKKRRTRQRRVSLKYPGGDMILIYRLTEAPAKSCAQKRCSGSVFSLTITQIYCRGEEKECIRLDDISRNEEDALYIFDMISRGAVTPCTAAEIVSDLIGIPR